MLGKPENRKLLARLLLLSQVGLEMVAPVIVGSMIDRWLGSSPWGVAVGALLGLTGGLIHLVILSKPLPGEDRPDEEQKS